MSNVLRWIGKKRVERKARRYEEGMQRKRIADIRREAFFEGQLLGAKREGRREGMASQRSRRGGSFGRLGDALGVLTRDVGDLGFGGGGYDPLTGTLRRRPVHKKRRGSRSITIHINGARRRRKRRR